MKIGIDTPNPSFLRKQESRVSKNLGAVLDNEIYLRWPMRKSRWHKQRRLIELFVAERRPREPPRQLVVKVNKAPRYREKYYFHAVATFRCLRRRVRRRRLTGQEIAG